MSQPFLYEVDTSYLLTRNTSERRFLLAPSKQLTEALLYCLADAQARHPVGIHAFCVMSNHLHIVFTDPDGHAPLFVQAMNQHIARYVNCLRRRGGAMWEGGARPNYCVLPKVGDIFDKVVYTLANPVKAGLVEHHHLWPGAISTAADIARGRIRTRRPHRYFSRTNDPSLLERDLILSPVPGASVLGVEDYARLVKERVAAEEKRIALDREARGLKWLGRKNCLSMDPFDAPPTEWKRGSLNPTVSSGNDEARRARLQRQRRFREKHREARREFLAGNRDVPFPEGTFYLRYYFGVPVEPFS